MKNILVSDDPIRAGENRLQLAGQSTLFGDPAHAARVLHGSERERDHHQEAIEALGRQKPLEAEVDEVLASLRK